MNPILIFLSMIICPNIGVYNFLLSVKVFEKNWFTTLKKKNLKKPSIYYFANKFLQALDLL